MRLMTSSWLACQAAGQANESREIAEIKQQIQKTHDATCEKDRHVRKLSEDLDQCRGRAFRVDLEGEQRRF